MGKKLTKREKVKLRVRSQIKGKVDLPRLCVFKSNKSMYAQIVDDVKGVTLTAASSKGTTGTKTEQASLVGKAIADKASALNITNIVFDRSGYVYHGRVKALAEGAREGGLQF